MRCRFVERHRKKIEIDELNDDENQLKAMFARITLRFSFSVCAIKWNVRTCVEGNDKK